jgi:hypothetical protein
MSKYDIATYSSPITIERYSFDSDIFRIYKDKNATAEDQNKIYKVSKYAEVELSTQSSIDEIDAPETDTDELRYPFYGTFPGTIS